MIRNIYIFFITLTLFIFQFLYAQDINEFNYYNYESGNIRHLNCDDYGEDPFLYFVCDSIHNQIIKANWHECSYYYNSLDETEQDNIINMFNDYQNDGTINNDVYGMSTLDSKNIIIEEEFWSGCENGDIDFKNGWGTFINNTNPYNSSLIIHVNHPINDSLSSIIAAKLFNNVGAEWLAIAGAHRYALVDDTTHCNEDLDSNCGADIAREFYIVGGDTIYYETAFQLFHEIISNENTQTISIHAHQYSEYWSGFFSKTGLIITNGCDVNGDFILPSNLTSSINYKLNQLDIWDEFDCNYEVGSVIVGETFDAFNGYPYQYLGACKNPQGQYTNHNNVTSDEWIQIEIERCIRDNPLFYETVMQAISEVINNSTQCYPGFTLIDDECYWQSDLDVIQDFMNQCGYTDELLEFGDQAWENGRLTSINLSDCNGTIPDSIGNLTFLDTLILNGIGLTGSIPSSICNLDIDWNDPLKFNISNNSICCPYPSCVFEHIGEQNTSNCTECSMVYVNCNADEGGDGTQNYPYTSIQDAINSELSAQPGTIIEVAPCSYYENINFHGRNIIVQSSHGPENTIIDGSNGATDFSVIEFKEDEPSTTKLRGFTIKNGGMGNNTINYGGGIFIGSGSASPTLENLIIEDNRAENGGGIYCTSNTAPTFHNVIIRNNQVYSDLVTRGNGGGVIVKTNSHPIFNNSYIFDNSASKSGGGIYITGNATIEINSTSIYDNSAINYGGGIYCYDESNIEIVGSNISSNSARIGGGIYQTKNSQSTISFTSINQNEVEQWGGGIYNNSNSNMIMNDSEVKLNISIDNGAGIYSRGNSIIEMYNSEITENTTNTLSLGGGFYLTDTTYTNLEGCHINLNSAKSGGGIYSNDSSEVQLTNVNINNNQAIDYGGGVNSSDNSRLTIHNSEIAGNSARIGGGSYSVESSEVQFNNVIIYNNSADEFGGGIYWNSDSTFNLLYSLLYSNSTNNDGGAIYMTGGSAYIQNVTMSNNFAPDLGEGLYGGNLTIINSILWDALDCNFGICNINYTNILYSGYDFEGSEGNIYLDPLFTDPNNGDYTLQEGSPCIDAGIIIEDMEYCGDAPDMGVYEYCFCETPLGDMNVDGVWNVLDIVILVNCILADNCDDLPNGCAGDMNGDGVYNVLDIVILVNCILADNCDEI